MEHQAQNFGLVKAGKKSKSSERKEKLFFVKFFFSSFPATKNEARTLKNRKENRGGKKMV